MKRGCWVTACALAGLLGFVTAAGVGCRAGARLDALEAVPAESLKKVSGDGWCLDDRLCKMQDDLRRILLQLDRIEARGEEE